MKQGVVVLVVSLTLIAAGARAQSPIPVSPGSRAGMAVVAGRCPTFNWTQVEGAESVDLLVYRVREENADGPPERVLGVTLPGSANGWTPSLGQCLEPGGRYGWSVGIDGEWSEASLFEVSSAPSMNDLEAAMAALESYSIARGEPARAVEASPDSSGPLRPERVRGVPGRAARPLRSESVGAATPPSGTIAGLGTYALSIDDDLNLGGYVFKDGYPFLHNVGGASEGNTGLGRNALAGAVVGYAQRNTAVGDQALSSNSTGFANTAVGANALESNLGGGFNTAVGDGPLQFNTEGYGNIAVGRGAMIYNILGNKNTAVGNFALRDNTDGTLNSAFGYGALRLNSTGSYNTAVGRDALELNRTGSYNTAVGYSALDSNVEGSRNIAIGNYAGFNMTTGDDNIFIGNQGLATENTTIRIGSGVHTQMFLGGVAGQVAGGSDPVLIGGNAKLGTIAASARRFKDEVRDVGGLTEKLDRLRVVSFRYKPEIAGSSDSRPEYGLIAEEVAEVLSELVVYDTDGEPLGVRYHQLVPLLLNELQRQRREVRRLNWLVGIMFIAGIALTVGRQAGRRRVGLKRGGEFQR